MAKDKLRPVAGGKSKTGKSNGKIRQALYACLSNRVKESIQNGYYPEAIALEESFMSDRLESYCTHKKYVNRSGLTLGQLLRKLKENDTDFAEIIRAQLEIWWSGRNSCLHEMAKFEDGEDAEWQAKLKKAGVVARDGQSLMRKVDKEHARLRRLAAKS
jgi:hypothetical protein